MRFGELARRVDAASAWFFAGAGVVLEAVWIARGIASAGTGPPAPGLGSWLTFTWLWLSELWIAPSIAFLLRRLFGIGWRGPRQWLFVAAIGLVGGGIPWLLLN